MAYPQERRTQVFTGPRFDNRVYRKGKIQGYSQNQNLDPRRSGADAAAMLEDQAGIKADSQGNWGSVRDYQRDLLLGSQQRNSLSPGVKAGYGSTLRTPLNSNLTPRNFSEGIRQRNQTLTPGAPVMSREQRIAQSQQEGTFDTIRDKYNAENAGSGLRMNRFGNIRKMNPMNEAPAKSIQINDVSDQMGRRSEQEKLIQPPSVARTIAPPAPPAPSQQDMNRAALEDRASGLRLLREMSQTPLQVTATDGGKNLVGKYGTGSATATTGSGRKEGMINGKPASEVLQGLANKQVREGTWRKGDRLPDAGTQNTKAYDRKSRSGLLTEEQALAESEKNRQNRQSLQRLNKR